MVDEFDPVATDPSLDVFNPDNGPPFSAEFVARVRAAQRARNERITAWVVDELERCGAAGYRDRLFVTSRVWADPRFVDPELDPNNRPPNSCYLGDPARANRNVYGVGLVSSLRTWLYRLRREGQGQPRILPVRVVPSTAPTARRQGDADGAVIEAELPTGVRLRFPAATDPAVIADLLRRLG